MTQLARWSLAGLGWIALALLEGTLVVISYVRI
jgi:hypothetical protein